MDETTGIPVNRASEPADLNKPALRVSAVRAAQGQQPFDTLIINGTVVDMVTGQTRKADVGIVGPLIASVHETGAHRNADKIIDASGQYVCPGLIDTHLHIESSMITPASYAQAVLPRGVTTIVWDPHEFANTCGLAGMRYALDGASSLPLRMLTLAPSSVPSAPGFETTGADFTAEVLDELLAQHDIAGVGEMMSMQAVLDTDERFTGIVQSGLNAGKRVCGHARGLTDDKLNAYVASGIETDHELTSADDLLGKLQAGLTIELRGSHDHLLPGFVEVLNSLAHFPQTLTLCTDDVFIDTLLEQGGLDDVVRRLVGYGLSPIKALQAATFNASVRIGRTDLGLIAPGKRADIVLFSDLQSFQAGCTLVNGVCVAEHGELLTEVAGNKVPDSLYNTVRSSHFSSRDFTVASSDSVVDVVVIEKPRFTRWGSRRLAVNDGVVQRPADLTLMAIVNRFKQGAAPKLAFLGEWGEWRGALATTVSHDSHNLTLFGGNENDLAVAANCVTDMGGGLAVAKDAQIIARLALPLAGLVSEASVESISRDFVSIREAMDQIVDWQPPYLVFKACFGASLVCNPGPRLSDVGIVDTSIAHRQDSPLGAVPLQATAGMSSSSR